MPESPHARLAIAILASVGLHAAALIQLKSQHAAADGALGSRTYLSARIVSQAPPSLDEPARVIERPPAAPPAADLASPPALPTERAPASPVASPAAPDIERAATPQQSPNPAPAPSPADTVNPGQHAGGVRIALPDEVQVHVRLFERGADENPNEVMQTESGKYLYFNSPQLKDSARPLTDARPHYPATKLDYPHGAVSLLLLIDEQGKLEKALVLCANPAFEASALASIRDMQFGAARDTDGPVKSYMLVDFAYGTGAPCGPLPATLQMQLDQRPR